MLSMRFMGYIRQIDLLRAFAILCVVITHWSVPGSSWYKISTTISGPFIFFTISGFLITRILISDREKAEGSGEPKMKVFKNFFIRRALRIFPAYYLTIFIVYFLSTEPFSQYYSYLTYTTNFHQNATQSWGVLPHLWTMAVEEQFYLFWPLIILFTPKKFLLPTILAFIVVGIGSRCILPQDDFSFTLPFACFDALGLGALLAWVLKCNAGSIPKVFKALSLLAVLSIVLLFISALHVYDLYVLHRTFIGLVTTWVLLFFVMNRDFFTGKYTVALSRVLELIGKMSYGIFLFHIPLIGHSYKVLGPLNELLLPGRIRNSPSILLVENFILLVLLSWLSWKFLELPIANLKRYFKTGKPKEHTALVVEAPSI